LSPRYQNNIKNFFLKSMIQMFFTPDTVLIDGALINMSIQLLIRWFTKLGKNDRIKFDESKVFKTYAIEIGELDLSRTYLQFYKWAAIAV